MRARTLPLFLWATFCAAAPEAAPLPRLDPAGIGGSLVLAGRDATETALTVFVKAADEKEGKGTVLFYSGDDSNATGEALRILRRLVPEERLAHTNEAAELFARLDEASGLWLAGAETESLLPLARNPDAPGALQAFLRSGKAVGATAGVRHLLGSQESAQHALSLLPDAHLGPAPPDELLERAPHLVAYEWDANATLRVRGRLIRAIGPGQVRIRRKTRYGEPPATLPLGASSPLADLTALRRTARDATIRPPAKAPKPIVRRGTLILIGGGGMPAGIVERFVKLAGGKEARIVVLPTAVPDPIPKPYRIDDTFRKAGADHVTVLPGRALEKVESAEYLAVLQEATGLWFGGGRQWRFVDAYLGTKAHPLMKDVLRRGGVVMGSSAGASIQAEYLARGNPLGNLAVMALGYERGLGFLPGAAVDQHFSQRNRFADLKALTQAYPRLLGIGIDESTALVVRKKIGEVTGKGKVFFYDNRTETGPEQTAVKAGERFNLVARKLVTKRGKRPATKDEPQ